MSNNAADGTGLEAAKHGASGSASPSAASSSAAEGSAPSFDLPSDITVAVERKATGDAVKDAILRDVAYSAVVNGRAAAVRYCEDQTTAYSKGIKTRKVLRTRPSDKDFILFAVQAQKDSAGDWQVTQVSWKKADVACVRG
ncbi:hypothetical protein [Streptomyces pseudovenezuelae]|uniref:hypothetical protein n=1 Tax=Streptomyces pseudovenezuelae TaxID=67350 RepID=UPI002472F14F|nr:hypothetical protein [Streptomyces pseudovenezuelae]